MNVIECDNLVEALNNLKQNNFKIVITSLKSKKTLYETDLNKKVVVFGNEANGVSKEVEKIADEKMIIPMFGKSESLNVSVSTGVVIYEYVRRIYKN